MGIWDKMKASGKKTKVQGELVLLEREMKQRKMAFGVELYDLLVADPSSFAGSNMVSNAISSNSNAKVFQLQQHQLSQPFDAAKSDIRDVQAQQNSMRNEQEALQATRTRGPEAMTASEKLAKAGTWVSTNAQETKLEAQVKLLDRDIRRRKEQFGLEVYDSYIAAGVNNDSENGNGGHAVSPSQSNKNNGGLRGRLTARMSQYSPKEKKIQECLDRTKNAINLLERQHKIKMTEISDLDEVIKGPEASTTSSTTTADLSASTASVEAK